jgi:hypothetical protein
LDGDALTIGNLGIVNESTAVQTVSLALTLAADQVFNANAGNLVIGGAVDLGSFTLTSTGAEDVTMNGTIS